MKSGVKKIMALALAVVFIGSASLLIRHMNQYDSGAEDQQAARELVKIGIPEEEVPLAAQPAEEGGAAHVLTAQGTAYTPADEIAAALSNMDLSELRAVNPDVAGWIHIPGTEIDYPVLQGEDNDYYLHHTWQHKKNIVGSIFMDYRNAAGFSDFNSILYGHHMRDGSMFRDLILYEKEDFLREHPYIYLVDDTGECIRYTVFAVYETETQMTYTVEFEDESLRARWLSDCIARSEFAAETLPDSGDKILTLSTCTGESYTSRWVVQAWAEG